MVLTLVMRDLSHDEEPSGAAPPGQTLNQTTGGQGVR
jgi:hypothetical protein